MGQRTCTALSWKPNQGGNKGEQGNTCARIFCTRYSKANTAKQNSLKCNICTLNCTLEEIAVLNFLREQPKATQKEIAAHIGKSERTVKTITVNLTEKGIIERKNGKRNGFWEIKINETNL